MNRAYGLSTIVPLPCERAVFGIHTGSEDY